MRSDHLVILLLCGLLTVSMVVPAAAGDSGWLLRQADLEVARLTGEMPVYRAATDGDVGGTSGEISTKSERSPAIPMLMSLVVPGSGELLLGYNRGFIQIALDAAAWYGGIYYSNEGDDLSDQYYAYADEHWFEGKLDAAYDSGYLSRPDANFDYSDVVGVGTEYFGFHIYNDPDTGLPLWVSKEDDRREYYENLGKWDQFVFGWDDFEDPRDFLNDPTINIANLKDPRTSKNRETYRDMRKAANDAYAKSDRFIYLNIAFRVFSVLQVAYLEGLLFGGDTSGGGEPSQLQVGSHQVNFFVEPVGYTRGVMGATVSF